MDAFVPFGDVVGNVVTDSERVVTDDETCGDIHEHIENEKEYTNERMVIYDTRGRGLNSTGLGGAR